MTEQTIHPVILAGGSGTRLWPLSRRSFPKQFAPLAGSESLFQAAARRLGGPGRAAPVIVTNAAFRFIVTEQLGAIGVDPAAILLEPEGRNTAPAILAAAYWLERTDPKAVMLVAPADHALADPDGFSAAVAAALPAARDGRIVTFGIRPDRAETAYGYLELASAPNPDGPPAPQPLARFVEKPEAAEAARMLASGRYLWNAGIFVMRVDTLLAAVAAHAPALAGPVGQAVHAARPDLGFLRLDPEAWAGAEDISIDYAVMERADNLVVVPYAGPWSDLGGWEAVWRAGAADDRGTVTAGPVTAIDCADTLLRSESERVELVGIGLRDLVAVATGDAVLVAHRREGQRVREAVAALRRKGAAQADTFPVDRRPWGWFESLATGDRFQVKRIVVEPGAALSLQSHLHRAEHWIVVRGTARVTIGEEVRLVTENQSVYIPLGTVHRLENPGKLPIILIEVQTGAYLGEDDIIRYDDRYARDRS